MKSKIPLLSFSTLLFGTMIYLLFRPLSLHVFTWLKHIGFDFYHFRLRAIAQFHIQAFPNWFLYSLPDGLWIFSYVSLLLFIWDFKFSYNSLFWILLVPSLAILSEIGQLFHVIPGTFDSCDLLFYIIGTILPLAFISNNPQYNYSTL